MKRMLGLSLVKMISLVVRSKELAGETRLFLLFVESRFARFQKLTPFVCRTSFNISGFTKLLQKSVESRFTRL